MASRASSRACGCVTTAARIAIPTAGQRLIDVLDFPSDPRIVYAAVENRAINVRWEAETARLHPSPWIGLRAHAVNDSQARPQLAPRLCLEGRRARRRARLWLGGVCRGPERSVAACALAWNGCCATGLPSSTMCHRRTRPFSISPTWRDECSKRTMARRFDVRSVAATRKPRLFGPRPRPAYRQSLPGASAGIPGCCTRWSRHPRVATACSATALPLREHLRAADPAAFAVLTQTAVPFLYRSKDTELYAERPADPAVMRGRSGCGALQQPVDCPIAAGVARCRAVLCRVSAIGGAAARPPVSSALPAARRRCRGVRQPTHVARAFGIFIRQASASPARLLPEPRQRAQRGPPVLRRATYAEADS